MHTLRALQWFTLTAIAVLPHCAEAKKSQHPVTEQNAQAVPTARAPKEDGVAESQLLEVYQLMAQGRSRDALAKVSNLVRDYPNFQLAQLVYGDLLAARIRPVQKVGDVPTAMTQNASEALGDLRAESLKRVRAAIDRPKPGTVPSQFISIAATTRHAIAVDASRSRLYLFENRPSGLTLIADYYTSIGKAGVSKAAQGDQRTPLGVYYITSHLEAASLKDFYGSGALPINYPNMLDAKRGKTGGGIWLHGTPPTQFARAPQASDGCLVLSNPDLRHVIGTVEVGSTPVLIAPQLLWVEPQVAKADGKPFEDTLMAWRSAKAEGNLERLQSFYTTDFNSFGKNLDQWTGVLRTDLAKLQGHDIQLKDINILRWTDSSDTMIVTMGEVVAGQRTGKTKRQYWNRQGGQWKIFFEGTL